MKIHTDFEDIGTIKNPVVTTGTFDGVHIGHKTILNRLNQLARQVRGESVLITFHPHPRKVLFPDKMADLKLINTQREKKYLLENTGIDHLFIIPFTLSFSQTTSQQFVNDILLGKLNAKIIIVGFNHYFGHNREGNFDYLHELSKTKNFMVEEIPMQDIENEAVSSTRIRKALAEGHIQRANAYLDHFYLVMGKTGKADISPLKKKQGFHAVEMEEEEKLIPPDGTYAVSVMENNCRAMAVVSREENRPHLYLLSLDEDKTLNHGEIYTLAFQKRIRTSDNIDSINENISGDIHAINELIF
ncbi:MAG: bifunctional riboflavin kinase/FAD synthetase [Bacteroidota bacterium]